MAVASVCVKLTSLPVCIWESRRLQPSFPAMSGTRTIARPLNLLILGGSAEARELAQALSTRGDISAIVSLAGVTRIPAPLPLPVRIGGFGGVEAQEQWIERHHIDAVIDATHPFAARIALRTARLCAGLGLPYLRLRRPGWSAGPTDKWVRIPAAKDAAQVIPQEARIFLATGRQSLPGFADLAGRIVHCRVVDPPVSPFPWPNGTWQIGRPPFSVAGETALFQRLGIDWLVAKDSGGSGGSAKLEAARALGLPVALLDRPPLPSGDSAETAQEALGWLAAIMAA